MFIENAVRDAIALAPILPTGSPFGFAQVTGFPLQLDKTVIALARSVPTAKAANTAQCFSFV
ncbi:MAG: hypothetical protein QM813_20160 [Verrucomicrobiota bacterium]